VVLMKGTVRVEVMLPNMELIVLPA
jgi:hypothetical protein